LHFKKKPPAPSALALKYHNNATSYPMVYLSFAEVIKVLKKKAKNAKFGQNQKCKKVQKCKLHPPLLPPLSLIGQTRQQHLVFDAKPEYMTKKVSSTS
jgi:hypothetical protein